MKTTSYLVFPLMVGLFCISKPLILVLLTEKWLLAVPFLQICCIYWLFQPMQTANWQAIKALGRSDLLMKLEIIKKILGISMLLFSMNISVQAIAMSNAVFAGISMIINMIPNKKLINYSMIEQFQDLISSFVLSILMGIIIYSLSFFNISALYLLILQIFIGLIIYIGASYILKLDSFMYIWNIIFKTKRRNQVG